MPACYKKGKEQGLWYEIKCLEETIKIKKQLDKDASFEKGILRAYKKLTEKDYQKPFLQSS
ncbi:unnamed protein product [marine sediment metagenome]|uniref:Uncharacterized protein n=1 Tax=marine sediment metagenome TaxID=412755 RepID=X0YH98_9ZZZZ